MSLSVVRQIARSILPPGVRMVPHKTCGLIVDRLYGIRTEGWYSLSQQDQQLSRNADGEMYQTCPYSILWSALRSLPDQMNGTFYDLGCGKGRVVAVFAKSRRFSKCVGVELIPTLANEARKNLSRSKQASHATIITADATTVDLSDGVAFFLHNPFGRATLTQILERVEVSCKGKPTYFIVYGMIRSDLYDCCTWLERYRITPRWGIWKSRF